MIYTPPDYTLMTEVRPHSTARKHRNVDAKPLAQFPYKEAYFQHFLTYFCFKSLIYPKYL